MSFIHRLLRLFVLLTMIVVLASMVAYIYRAEIGRSLEQRIVTALQEALASQGIELVEFEGLAVRPHSLRLRRTVLRQDTFTFMLNDVEVPIALPATLRLIHAQVRSQQLAPSEFFPLLRLESSLAVFSSEQIEQRLESVALFFTEQSAHLRGVLEYAPEQRFAIEADVDFESEKLVLGIGEGLLFDLGDFPLEVGSGTVVLSPWFSPAHFEVDFLSLSLSYPRSQLRHALQAQGHLVGLGVTDQPKGIEVDAQIEARQLDLRASVQVFYAFGSEEGRIQYRIETEELKKVLVLLSDPAGLPPDLAGKATLEGEINLSQVFPHKAQLQFDLAPMKYAETQLSNIRGNATISLGEQSTSINGRTSFAATYADIEFQSGEIRFVGDPEKGWNIDADAQAFGGSLSMASLLLNSNFEPQGQARLRANGLSLKELLEIYPSTTLSGDGTLNLDLPLHFKAAGVAIEAGVLRANPPIGRLSYRAEEGGGLPRELGFLIRVLEDYRFSQLEADVDLEADGALILNTRLTGSNPAVNKGQEVNVNLSLEENLPKLLESIRLLRDPRRVVGR